MRPSLYLSSADFLFSIFKSIEEFQKFLLLLSSEKVVFLRILCRDGIKVVMCRQLRFQRADPMLISRQPPVKSLLLSLWKTAVFRLHSIWSRITKSRRVSYVTIDRKAMQRNPPAVWFRFVVWLTHRIIHNIIRGNSLQIHVSTLWRWVDRKIKAMATIRSPRTPRHIIAIPITLWTSRIRTLE